MEIKTTKTNHQLGSVKNSVRWLWNQQKPAAQLDSHHQYQLPTANTIANPTPAKWAATVSHSILLVLQIIHEHMQFIYKMHQLPPHSYSHGAVCYNKHISLH